MNNLFTKQAIIGFIIAIGTLLIAIFSAGLYSSSLNSSTTQNTTQQVALQDDKPRIVGTVPNDLDQSTILPNQTIEIHFSDKLENEPETRWEIQPSADIKVSLADDNKTLKFTPNKPFNLGQAYTLFIKSETKIQGKKTLDHEYQYHFKTIEFKGA